MPATIVDPRVLYGYSDEDIEEQRKMRASRNLERGTQQAQGEMKRLHSDNKTTSGWGGAVQSIKNDANSAVVFAKRAAIAVACLGVIAVGGSFIASAVLGASGATTVMGFWFGTAATASTVASTGVLAGTASTIAGSIAGGVGATALGTGILTLGTRALNGYFRGVDAEEDKIMGVKTVQKYADEAASLSPLQDANNSTTENALVEDSTGEIARLQQQLAEYERRLQELAQNSAASASNSVLPTNSSLPANNNNPAADPDFQLEVRNGGPVPAELKTLIERDPTQTNVYPIIGSVEDLIAMGTDTAQRNDPDKIAAWDELMFPGLDAQEIEGRVDVAITDIKMAVTAAVTPNYNPRTNYNPNPLWNEFIAGDFKGEKKFAALAALGAKLEAYLPPCVVGQNGTTVEQRIAVGTMGQNIADLLGANANELIVQATAAHQMQKQLNSGKQILDIATEYFVLARTEADVADIRGTFSEELLKVAELKNPSIRNHVQLSFAAAMQARNAVAATI